MSENTKHEYPIKTVVILVQENRSFDHMLGWMKSLNPDIQGVTGKESNTLSASDPNSTRIYYRHQSANVEPDPGHSFEAVYEQIYGVPWDQENADRLPPTMEGFAQQAESIQKGMSEIVMNGFRPESVPVYKQLITEFAVCDRWFSSVPTLTQPNRLFIHSATSYGATANDTKMLVEGYPQKTIFESVEEGGFSFGIYHQYPPSTLFYRFTEICLQYIVHFAVLHGPSGPYPTSEFEHSSIPATVKKIFNLKSFLTKRDAWAGTFECVLNTNSPRTDCPVELTEPVKMRVTEANEDAKLSEFQEELVKMCAVLKGDHNNTEIFPHKIVKDMKVVEAVDYVGVAFRKFRDDCDDAIRNGADESHIVCLANPPKKRVSKSFARRLCSCLACGH